MRPQGFGQVGNGLEDLGWNDMGFEPPKPHEAPRDAEHDAFGEELEDQPRVHPTGLTPVQSPVHTQHAEIADRLGVEESSEESSEDSTEDEEYDETAEPYEEEPAPVAVIPSAAPAVEPDESFEPEPAFEAPVPTPAPMLRRAPRARSAPGTKGKAAFTLRLDKERHLKLRLACAVNGRSAQQLVTDALDQLLTGMPELEVMAEKAKRKG